MMHKDRKDRWPCSECHVVNPCCNPCQYLFGDDAKDRSWEVFKISNDFAKEMDAVRDAEQAGETH